MLMSVLVTGVDTILGYHITRALESSGFVVRALVPSELDPIEQKGTDSSFCVAQTGDLESCQAALLGVSAVFHCESGHLVNAGPVAQRAFIEGTRNLLVAMSRAGVEDLVYAGSAFTFQPGDMQQPGDESVPWDNPLELTCLDTLRAAGELINRYNESGRIRCVTISPTLVMGDHDMPGGAGWWLIEQAVAGARGDAPGSINVVRARDAARAAVKALGRGKSGQVYILGGQDLSDQALLDEISALCGVETPTHRRASRLARVAKKLVPRVRAPEPEISKLAAVHLCYTAGRAAAQLGLESAPADQTVREAVEWYLSRAG